MKVIHAHIDVRMISLATGVNSLSLPVMRKIVDKIFDYFSFCADSIGKLWKKLASNGVSVVVWCFKENLWLSHLCVREVEIGNTY